MASYFEPADQKEHARGMAGRDVSDWCSNCSQPFMEHTNGKCPEPDEDDE